MFHGLGFCFLFNFEDYILVPCFTFHFWSLSVFPPFFCVHLCSFSSLVYWTLCFSFTFCCFVFCVWFVDTVVFLSFLRLLFSCIFFQFFLIFNFGHKLIIKACFLFFYLPVLFSLYVSCVWVLFGKTITTWRCYNIVYCCFSGLVERLRGRPHGNALLCKCTCFASFWPIVHMDPVNALFWNRVSGCENAALANRWRHRPTPRPLAFDLWTPRRLITTTTTTMAVYLLVFVLQNCNLLTM